MESGEILSDEEYNRLSTEALQCYRRGDYEDAFLRYLELGEKGYEEVQLYLARAYLTGKGTERNPTRAKYWMELAARRGCAAAQWHAGCLYVKEKDYVPAIHWLKKSAEQGYTPAIYGLAGMYNLGKGVPKNKRKAFELLEKATRKGHLKAQAEYGKRLMIGCKGAGSIFLGMRLFVKAAFKALRLGITNPNDERILW